MLGAATTSNALLQELQQIWIDIGETEAEKDRMLMEFECLEVYRRKVVEDANAKARLHQSVAAKEAELATLMTYTRNRFVSAKCVDGTPGTVPLL